jgi:hypothetical protein
LGVALAKLVVAAFVLNVTVHVRLSYTSFYRFKDAVTERPATLRPPLKWAGGKRGGCRTLDAFGYRIHTGDWSSRSAADSASPSA